MDTRTFALNGTVIFGIALMALTRVFGLSIDGLPVGCGVMMLAASCGCLQLAGDFSGLRRNCFSGLGIFGLVSTPLVVSALTLTEPYVLNSAMVTTLMFAAAIAALSYVFFLFAGSHFKQIKTPSCG